VRPRAIDRRVFLAGALAAIAAPLTAQAQAPARTAHIGLISPFTAADTAAWHQAFRQGLGELGWVEGKNLRIEYRYADGRGDRLPRLAAELVALRVDVIVAAVTPDTLAAKNATRTIPIVMASVGDPAATGLVDNLARPGGNVTGLSQLAPDLAGKRLELLTGVVPALSRVAVLWNPQDLSSTLSWKEIQRPARELRIQLQSLETRSAGEIPRAFEAAASGHARALVIMPGPVYVTNMRRIAELALKGRLPAIFHLTEFVKAGGLLAYGPDRADLFRRAATYVDKILKGAKPADLPVEQPTKFEFAVNLKTAKALGLTIPPSLLLRADQVIE
jgi:putative ABC transport system substrate-binding protein